MMSTVNKNQESSPPDINLVYTARLSLQQVFKFCLIYSWFRQVAHHHHYHSTRIKCSLRQHYINLNDRSDHS